ncbi:MAG TPA: glycosyltransferase family 2 protein [Flavipsychrobacter sp.]|nr:glycosyltransferase family 2 protein [Flavipsychrobacter sp.]
MISISACIITYNEEKNIARCIEAVRKVADEVVVIDSFSTDKTVDIATHLGAKVMQRKFLGYGDQKFFAQQQASHQWVLSIDADEVVSPKLAESILFIKTNPKFNAYKVDILPNYCGKWIRHCGWYPQPKLRLWNKEKGAMLNDKVHEGIELHDKNEKIGRLKGDLLHYSYDSISDHLRKIEHYTEISARADVARGKKVSFLKMVVAPPLQFLNDLIFKLGFLDGEFGFIVCKNNAFASFIKYAKTRHYSRLKKEGINF